MTSFRETNDGPVVVTPHIARGTKPHIISRVRLPDLATVLTILAIDLNRPFLSLKAEGVAHANGTA